MGMENDVVLKGDNFVQSDHGFKMFSMMDFPHKSLKKYSLDPIQSLIYSMDDLGHTNGILTDRDVIEDPTSPAMKATGSEAINAVPSLKPIRGNLDEQNKGERFAAGPASKRTDKLKENIPNEIRLSNRNENSLVTRRPTVTTTKTPEIVTTRPVLRRDKISNKLTSSFGARRNFPNRKNIPGGRVQTWLQQFDKISPFVRKSQQNSLREIQKTVAIGDVKEPPKQKVSRSPLDRGEQIDKSIEEQLKKLKPRPARNPSKPNEKDFYFFKDAFEYGTRLLARRLAKGEPVDATLEHVLSSSSYDFQPNRRNDLEEIKSSVQENILKMTPENNKDKPQSERKEGRNNNAGTFAQYKTTPSMKHQSVANHLQTTYNKLISKKLNERKSKFDKKPTNSVKTSAKDATQTNLSDLNKGTYDRKTEGSRKFATKRKDEGTDRLAPTKAAPKGVNDVKYTDKQRSSESKLITITSTPPKTSGTVKISSQKRKSLPTKGQTRNKVLDKTTNTLSKKHASFPTGKVTVSEVKMTKKEKKKNLVVRGKPTMPISRAKESPGVFSIPEWKLPPFYYRRPCPRRADAMFRTRSNKIYAIDGQVVYVIGPNGVELGPLPLNFVWPEVRTPVSDGYVRPLDHMVFLFFENKYAAYINDRQLVGDPSDISAIGLPSQLASFDAVASWTGNSKTYYFKDKYYWRYNDYESKVDTGYPRLIKRNWQNVPDKVDTALIAPNSYLYFIKEGLIYKMNYRRASVQSAYPKRLSDSCYDFFL